VERLPIASGGELLTIFGRLDGMKGGNGSDPEVPLISVVRDTLNDTDPENDRLRYVWMLTYARPNLTKRAASAIPFFYQHIESQRDAANSHRNRYSIWRIQNSKRGTGSLDGSAACISRQLWYCVESVDAHLSTERCGLSFRSCHASAFDSRHLRPNAHAQRE
jgi:hypothetical protein